MKLAVRPGKRNGSPKILFAADLDTTYVTYAPTGEITVTVMADDIYTRNATQRYSITLNPKELELLCHLGTPAALPESS